MAEKQTNHLTINTENIEAQSLAVSGTIGQGVREIASAQGRYEIFMGSTEMAGAVASGYLAYKTICKMITARNQLLATQLTALSELSTYLKGSGIKDPKLTALLQKAEDAHNNFVKAGSKKNAAVRRALSEALDDLKSEVMNPSSPVNTKIAELYDEALIDPILNLERAGAATTARRLQFIKDFTAKNPKSKSFSRLQQIGVDYSSKCENAIENMFNTAKGDPADIAKAKEAVAKAAKAGTLTKTKLNRILTTNKIGVSASGQTTCIESIKTLKQTMAKEFDEFLGPTRAKILTERVSHLDAIIKADGKGAITKYVGKEARGIASLSSAADDVAKLTSRYEQIASQKGLTARMRKAFTAIKSPKVMGPALCVASIALAAMSVDNLVFDTTTEEAFDAIAQKLSDKVKTKSYKYNDKETRKNLIERALAASPDEQTRRVLEGIKNADYDYGQYLINSNDQIRQNLSGTGEIAQAWVSEQTKIFCANASELFYSELERQLKNENTQTKGMESHIEDNANQSTTSSGDELATGDLQPISATPKSEREVCEEKLAAACTRLDKMLQEDPEAKPVLEKYLKGEKLTSEEEAKIVEYIPILTKIQNAQKELATLNGGKQTEGGLDNKGKSADSTAKAGKAPVATKGIQGANLNPALLQPNAAQAALTRSGTQEGLTPEEIKKKKEMANLPPEAIVQQPEEESFWTWKNILLILAAVGTLGIGAYFIIKYKKKADDAKKETSSLQSTVNDLQSQVNDLQGNTDSTNGTTPSIDEGLTKSASLANVATNITNTSLDSTNTILSGNDNTRV